MLEDWQNDWEYIDDKVNLAQLKVNRMAFSEFFTSSSQIDFFAKFYLYLKAKNIDVENLTDKVGIKFPLSAEFDEKLPEADGDFSEEENEAEKCAETVVECFMREVENEEESDETVY